MPEGPECRVVANAVQKGIGTRFEAAEIIENVSGTMHRYSREPIAHWHKLQQPWVLKAVRTKGKLIIFEIEICADQEQLWILSTLGMSGDWRWNSAGHKHCRIAFIRVRGDLSFVDTRCFGTIRIVTPQQGKQIESKIGWDLLRAPCAKKRWDSFKETLADKPIGEALLSQNHFSGIGNIYKAEILYALKIDPTTKVSELTDDEWRNINVTAHEILQKAYKLNGSSIVDFTADGVEGSAQTILKIYGKEQCPKGHQTNTIKQGKGASSRTTWWCPACISNG